MHFSAFFLLIDCGWWPELLLPLLFLSWFLGWLLRGGSRKYKNRIEDLELSLRKSTAKSTGLEKEVSGLRFDYDKLGGENKDLRNNLANSNDQINTWRTKYSSLESEKSDWESSNLLSAGNVANQGPSQEEFDRLQAQLSEARRSLAEAERKLISRENDGSQQSNELAELKRKYTSLESDLGVSKDKLSATEKALADCESRSKQSFVSPPVTEAPKDSNISNIAPIVSQKEAAPQQKGMGAYFESTNLQIIEGVGPKIEGLLKTAGYHNWSDIAGSDISDLQKVLDNAGPRYRIHNPKKWADQAGFAANGEWEKLIQYQKDIDGGDGGHSKAEKLYFKAIGFAASKPSDLKVVEGVGPKIESLLKAAGINNWSELAGTSVSKIQEVLSAAGDRYRLADPKTWPKQAELAAAGKWAELKEYQDFLNGGKE